MTEDDKLHPLGVGRFVTGKHRNNDEVGGKQKRIIPDKSGEGKHKVEEDKASDSTKPPTEKKDK